MDLGTCAARALRRLVFPDPDGPMMASSRPGLAAPETPSRMRLGLASAPSFFVSFLVGWRVMRTSSHRTTTSSRAEDASPMVLLLPDSSSRSLSLARMPRSAASPTTPGILMCGGHDHSAMPAASSSISADVFTAAGAMGQPYDNFIHFVSHPAEARLLGKIKTGNNRSEGRPVDSPRTGAGGGFVRRDMPLMLKRQYDALVAASGVVVAKKPSREPEPARVFSNETRAENAAATKDDPNDADDASTHVVSARLVGSKRHKEGRARLKHGTALRLRRDRANAHDPNAIAVDVTVGMLPIHAGFVKGAQAAVLAPALDSGALAVVACVVDAPNGVDALPTAEVPVRLTLRRRQSGGDASSSGGDASSASTALELLTCPYDVPASVGHVPPAILEGAFAAPAPGSAWFTHHDDTPPSVFAALNPVTKASAEKQWVYVERRKKSGAAGDDSYVGKWMIMGVQSDDIDAWFVECAKAVEAGEFVAAKAPAGGGDEGDKGDKGVLICYTRDFRDRGDVEGAGVALKRRFGCGMTLRYKTDSATYAGMYASHADGGRPGRGGKTCCYEMRSGSLRMDVDEATYSRCLALAEKHEDLPAEEVITIDD